ncbi:hypothetical protein JCM8547_002884 [Rhodosporidiobolus lusitaniae]
MAHEDAGAAHPDSADLLTLTLRLATHPVHPSPSSHSLTVGSGSSVKDLKQRLNEEWDGKPKVEGITVVKGGRVLRDAEMVKEVFEEEMKTTPFPELVLHVIVRPNAWSAPFAAPPPPTTTSSDAAPPIPAVQQPVPSPALSAQLDPPSSSSSGLAPPPVIQETPPTPIPTPPPQSSGYAPAYVSAVPDGSTPTAAADGSLPPPPAGTTPAAPPPASSGSAGRFAYYLAYLHKLIPLQRALLLLNLQKAHGHYLVLAAELSHQLSHPVPSEEKGKELDEEKGLSELKEVEELFKGCGLWVTVEEAEKEAEKEYEEMLVRQDAPKPEEFQVVQIAGRPYLLHTPQALLAPPPLPRLDTFLALRRAQTVHLVLTTLLQLLLTFQPSAAATAYGRGIPSGSPAAQAAAAQIRQGYRGPNAPPGAAANPLNQAILQQQQLAALAAVGGAPIPGLGGAPAGGGGGPAGVALRRRGTISIMINLEVLVSLLVPLLFLSLKLGFLFWIFGRHASTSKRIILGVMAVLWVGWEGWGIQRRRVQAVRERERLERERRRAARAAARGGPAAVPPQAAPVPQPQPPHLVQQLGQPQPVVPQPVVPGAPPPAGAAPAPAAPRRRTARRDPPSRFSPKYWINAIAALGLVSEARELGLQPRFIAGRPIPPAPPPPRTPAERQREALKRALRNVLVGVVLFFGTLSPEVEKKRRRALEKRERLLRERRAAQERARAVRVVQAERQAAAGQQVPPTSMGPTTRPPSAPPRLPPTSSTPSATPPSISTSVSTSTASAPAPAPAPAAAPPLTHRPASGGPRNGAPLRPMPKFDPNNLNPVLPRRRSSPDPVEPGWLRDRERDEFDEEEMNGERAAMEEYRREREEEEREEREWPMQHVAGEGIPNAEEEEKAEAMREVKRRLEDRAAARVRQEEVLRRSREQQEQQQEGGLTAPTSARAAGASNPSLVPSRSSSSSTSTVLPPPLTDCPSSAPPASTSASTTAVPSQPEEEPEPVQVQVPELLDPLDDADLSQDGDSTSGGEGGSTEGEGQGEEEEERDGEEEGMRRDGGDGGEQGGEGEVQAVVALF